MADVFHRGNRVVMTKAAETLFPNSPRTGTVIDVPRTKRGKPRIAVRLDGETEDPGYYWHAGLWRKVEA